MGWCSTSTRYLCCLVFLVNIYSFCSSALTQHGSEVEAFFQGSCAQGLICQHSCEDLPRGGFKCSCKKGYRLHDNGFSCLEEHPDPATTIAPELHDLDASEDRSFDDENDLDSSDLADAIDREEQSLQDLAGSNSVISVPSWEISRKYHLAPDDTLLGDDPAAGGTQEVIDDVDDEEEVLPQDDVNAVGDVEALDDLAKRGREKGRFRQNGRERGRGRGRDRGKGGRRKGKGRKGKGRGKGKDRKLKGIVDMYPQDDMPIITDYIVANDKVEDKTSIQNEIHGAPPPVHHTCAELQCKGGGRCVRDTMLDVGRVRCHCPLGTEGTYCERDVMVKYPQFMGDGYEAFPVLRGAYKEFHIIIEFRPDTHNGLLMFSGEIPSRKSDFFSIALFQGYVEFRFDCGSGMAKVRSENTIVRGEWNVIKVHRNDWYGSLVLNDGPEARGRSKGMFSRITFREDLYLGGYKNASAVGPRTEMKWGFIGCVRLLDINGKIYDMRKGAFVGDAIHGVNVAECSAHVCDAIQCMNSGTCVADSADTSVCLCAIGTAGDRCESRIDIHVPSFDGNSYLQFLGLRQLVMSFLQMEVVLKPSAPTGIILYNGYTADRTGDFIMLAMRDGFVEFRFDLGSGPAVIRSAHPLSMNEWHIVRFSRTGRDGYLQVDNQAAVEGLSKGAYTQLTLTLDLFVGGHRNYDEVAKSAHMKESFKGCIQKVVVNEKPLKLTEEALHGVNVANCIHPCSGQPCQNGGRCVPIKDFYKCSCPLGFENTNCEDRIVRFRYRYRFRRDIEEKITLPSFSGDSYLMYNDPALLTEIKGSYVDIQMRIRVDGPDGVVFWASEAEMTPMSDYLAIGLHRGHLQFRYNLGAGEVVIAFNHSRIDDGKWHRIRASRMGRTGYLEVDTEIVEGTAPGNLNQLNVYGRFFLGGMDDIWHSTYKKFEHGFSGCISNLTLATSTPVHLMEAAVKGVNVQQCAGADGKIPGRGAVQQILV